MCASPKGTSHARGMTLMLKTLPSSFVYLEFKITKELRIVLLLRITEEKLKIRWSQWKVLQFDDCVLSHNSDAVQSEINYLQIIITIPETCFQGAMMPFILWVKYLS